MLQTAFVSVTSASKRRVKARVLFDTGAQRTFITRRLTSRLGCESSCKETLSISSFGTDFSDRAQFELVTINLISETGEIGIEALVTPAISPPIKMKFNKEWLKLVDLDGLKLADNLHEDVLDVDILIGNDYYGSLMTGNVMKQNGIMAMECVFGWLLSGPVYSEAEYRDQSSCLKIGVASVDNEELNRTLQRFWEIDSYAEDYTYDDDTVMQQFKETIRFDDDERRYVVQLPWKRSDVQLQDNYLLCKRRLRVLINKLRRMNKLREYDKILEDQRKKDLIEEVNLEMSTEKVHYLPHFVVLKEDSSTTKMRIVYCASAY